MTIKKIRGKKFLLQEMVGGGGGAGARTVV